MFALILSLLYAVSVQSVYSRTYLRGLKRIENERIQTQYIHIGYTYIEDAVFAAAKQGLLQCTTRPFLPCETPGEFSPTTVSYNDPNDPPIMITNMFDKDVCENIINGIKSLIIQQFPDSEIRYNTKTKRYTIKWD
jgi:hypothetical protein